MSHFKIFRHIAIAAAIAGVGASAHAATDNILALRDTITDPHLVYPESFEADTHQLMRNWYLQNYAVLDYDIDNTADVATTDEQYISRLMSMPTTIEMPFNSVVRDFIKVYTERRRSLTETMLGMSLYYMPIFEQALEVEGVPLELKYLPIIESALNPNAVSRAGATGLWQFMLATARGLGMEINTLVDERRDPVQSSKMAARYLRQLYDMYGDWSLAIAAYNCGPGNVNKALRRAGEGKKDFWDIYNYLPQETRGYVPAFIGATYAMTYYDKHNISPALARRPIITDSIHINKRVHFQQIADVLNIPIEEIRILNPQYRCDVIPGDSKPYPLVLPSHQVLSYIVSEDSIVAHNAALYARRDVVEPGATSKVSDDGKYDIIEEIKYHKVRKGETFNSIARRYGVTVSSIKRYNGIKKLRTGRTIKIKTTKKVPRPVEEEAEETTLTPEVEESIVVEESVIEAPDDADAIDAADDETAEECSNADESADESAGETDSEEDAGEIVREVVEEEIAEAEAAEQAAEVARPSRPEPPATSAPAKSAEPKPVYHKVARGENLYKISQKYHTTVDKIVKLNNGLNPSKINVGQRIRVK